MRSFTLFIICAFFLASCGMLETAEPKEVCGCTDVLAANYNEKANCEDGSCVYLDDEMRTLNTLFTSTGCGACGIYGIDCHSNYSDQLLDKALPFELHFKYGDPMINETNDSFVRIARPRYSPYFAVGLQESMIIGQDRPETCELSGENAQKLIAQFYDEYPGTQVGISHTLNQDSLSIHFAINSMGLSGLHYAIYVLEDSLVFTQNAGWRNDIEGWVHNHVVREALTPVLGKALASTEKIGEIAVRLRPEWQGDNIYAMIVLWDRSKSLPRVVNAERSY